MLRLRYHAQAQTFGKTEKRQKTHENGRPGDDSAVGFFGSAQIRIRLSFCHLPNAPRSPRIVNPDVQHVGLGEGALAGPWPSK